MNMAKLSNAEFMLLQIICERGELSGYEIDRLVKERGYREWANIGTTSIYIGLEKLKNKNLVDFYIDGKKQGRGPLPKKFKVNDEGKKVLKQEILKGLLSSRGLDRFYLAFAATPFLTAGEVIKALQGRKQSLAEDAAKIKKIFAAQGGKKLPLNVRILFEHPLFLIKNETEFTDNLIEELKSRER